MRDGAPSGPVPRSADGGRGMTLVELISDTWGVDPVADEHGGGKEVWFELRPRPDGRSWAPPTR